MNRDHHSIMKITRFFSACRQQQFLLYGFTRPHHQQRTNIYTSVIVTINRNISDSGRVCKQNLTYHETILCYSYRNMDLAPMSITGFYAVSRASKPCFLVKKVAC
jgi:hypothetical protein